MRLFLTPRQVSVLYSQFRKQYGLCSGEGFVEFFEHLIQEKTGIKNCTFIELHEATAGNLALKDLTVVALNLNKCCTEIFSWDRTPDVVISSAVRASIAIPFIFTPERISIKPPGGKLSRNVTYGDQDYLDGGVLDNYPEWLFADKKTLGFRLLKPTLWEKYAGKANDETHQTISGVMSFLKALPLAIWKKQESDFVNRADDAKTIIINTREVNSLDFGLNQSKKKILINNGRQAAEVYFRNYKDTFFSQTTSLLPRSARSDKPTSDRRGDQFQR